MHLLELIGERPCFLRSVPCGNSDQIGSEMIDFENSRGIKTGDMAQKASSVPEGGGLRKSAL